MTSAQVSPRSWTTRCRGSLLPQICCRPGPKSVSAATNALGRHRPVARGRGPGPWLPLRADHPNRSAANSAGLVQELRTATGNDTFHRRPVLTEQRPLGPISCQGVRGPCPGLSAALSWRRRYRVSRWCCVRPRQAAAPGASRQGVGDGRHRAGPGPWPQPADARGRPQGTRRGGRVRRQEAADLAGRAGQGADPGGPVTDRRARRCTSRTTATASPTPSPPASAGACRGPIWSPGSRTATTWSWSGRPAPMP